MLISSTSDETKELYSSDDGVDTNKQGLNTYSNNSGDTVPPVSRGRGGKSNRMMLLVTSLVAVAIGCSLLKEGKYLQKFLVLDNWRDTRAKTVNDTTTSITTATTTYAVFYHVFLNPDAMQHSATIVNEQLTSWKNSSLAEATLYYGLIVGRSSSDNIDSNSSNGTISLPCPKGCKCHKLYQQAEGWESDTQQHLFEYCVNNPQHNVVYIHTKGSYHDHDNNRILRIALTRSALSDECQNGLISDMCTVCSARFSPLPHWHVSGNMWTAKCSYVANLIPPNQFEPLVRQAVFAYASKNNLGRPWEALGGYGRYSVEHWIHTNGRLKPCDVFPDMNLTWGYVAFDPMMSPLELHYPDPTAVVEHHHVYPCGPVQ